MKNVIDQLSTDYNLTKKLAKEVIEAVVEGFKIEVFNSGKLKVGGLGTFSIKDVSERKGRNPKTGAEITIPAKKTLAFKAEKSLRYL